MATVAHIFENHEQARRAIVALRESGVPAEDISLVARDPRGKAQAESSVAATGALDTTAIGAASGGMLGGMTGLLVGMGSLTIPGIGPALAAGPIAGGLAGGVMGLGVGGVIGALIEQGISEKDAQTYQLALERGGMLVAARVPKGDEPRALAILENLGSPPLQAHRRRRVNNPNDREGLTDGELGTDREIGSYQLAEPGHSSDAGTGAVLGGTGGALIGGIAAGPLGAGVGAAMGALAGATVAEAIHYAEVEPEFRRHWEEEADRGHRPEWPVANLAYRHGWESAQNAQHQGRSWEESHPSIQSAWREGIPWDQAEPLIRRGWEHYANSRERQAMPTPTPPDPQDSDAPEPTPAPEAPAPDTEHTEGRSSSSPPNPKLERSPEPSPGIVDPRSEIPGPDFLE